MLDKQSTKQTSPGPGFQRVAIVNRGEPALRLIAAVREYNHEHGLSIKTIALYTEPDRQAMFVREADEALSIGEATWVDPADGNPKSSYLDQGRLGDALRSSRADAVWVGWGFVAEKADFAELCVTLGVTFIGPGAEVMRRLGDKITSKRIAEEAGVPVAPWSGGPIETTEQSLEVGERLGYPLMVKATAGGGGRGIRRVSGPEELERALETASSEALKAFGDGTVFMEKQVTGARHVEVQIIADQVGSCWALGVRDCSVQRRNQKVMEETPSPGLTIEQDLELRAAAVRLAQAVGYNNAGTVEFLYDPATKTFSFMEVNARLQVEHPVTEMVTGADLVKLQLHVARGGVLKGDPPAPRGHAMELRLNAEDPDNGFAPAPGTIERFRLPAGPGLRVDTGFEEGDEVAPQFDSMIAKIIAWGADRQEALARLERALTETAVLIHGGASNKSFLLELLHRPEVKSGDLNVGWLDQLMSRGEWARGEHGAVALIQAAISAYESEVAAERALFFAAAARGRPSISAETGRTMELSLGGQVYKLPVSKRGGKSYRVVADGAEILITLEQVGRQESRLRCAGRWYRILSGMHGVTHVVEVEGESYRISRDEAGVVRAPAPSVVVSVTVEPGDQVKVGDTLCVLEVMKTEMEVRADFPGTVREVMVIGNLQVGPGAPLMLVEPPREEQENRGTQRISLDHLSAPTGPEGATLLQELRSLGLGFDADADAITEALKQGEALNPHRAPDDPGLLAEEEQLLSIFVDICALFHRLPAAYSAGRHLDRPSSEEYFFTYLRDPSRKGEGLPEAFLVNLKRALAHYGLETLERTPDLDECLLRICKAYRRLAQQRTPIMHILQRRLDQFHLLPENTDLGLEELMPRLILQTRELFPAVNDLARELHYRQFQKPILDRARQDAYARAEEQLRLASRMNVDEAERARAIQTMVALPQPLKSFFSQRLPDADRPTQEVMLHTLVRRYHRTRQVQDLTISWHRQLCLAQAHQRGDKDDQLHLIAAHVTHQGLDQALGLIRHAAAELPGGTALALDLYVWRAKNGIPPEEVSADLRALLDRANLPAPVRRVVVTISSPVDSLGMGTGQLFTFRPGPDGGFTEDQLTRGVHPQMAGRLQLFRLTNFKTERLHSQEGVYLFRAVGRSNDKDERLIAHAEVRDLTPVRDSAGQVVGLPDMERTFLEAVAAIRMFQVQRPDRRRLHWNRVHLFVQPVLKLSSGEMQRLVSKLVPAIEGLGLERVLVTARIPDEESGEPRETVIDMSKRGGSGVSVRLRPPPRRPMEPLSQYEQSVVRLRQRDMLHPYELLALLAPDSGDVQSDFPPGDFTEYDLGEDGSSIVPVERPPGQNQANIITGLITNYTAKFPEGMTRVILLGDPCRSMGSLAEPECRRILGALKLARRMGLPVEWFSLSAGAKISMESGTENMDWIAEVLRELVNFTQEGGEVNVVVNGINVGAQPYWNAEATMLMHTRGILIMTPQGAMVLTGKRALDYSGGVSAEDNLGIGGYERIMGPNGQAQFFAHNISEACQVLLRHYQHTYRLPGQPFPERITTSDPWERDVGSMLHSAIDGTSFEKVADIFDAQQNPGRKKPFDIRQVMRATVDQDHRPLERWFGMRNAETAVVWDAHLGGQPVCLIGMESRPLSRVGPVPADGPERWSAGTLFPMSSKKVGRAINACSGNRPLVLLANLSGFDGSPESMRDCQLEFGAEIGRAVVNFSGPIIFCVISRYHGGAFVVFSNRLNDNMEVAALEGSHASVIGGAPAAAVVFAREVHRRTKGDPRVEELAQKLSLSGGQERIKLAVRYEEITRQVESEKLGEVAEQFDAVHSIQRAMDVGSVNRSVPPSRLRPYLIDAVERGISKELTRQEEEAGEIPPHDAGATGHVAGGNGGNGARPRTPQ